MHRRARRPAVREALPSTPEHLAEKIRAGRGALEGERKQVTVLFADVAGSMELAETTDAEAWQAIMERFFAMLCSGVHRFEGTVDKFTGDGIMALFGAPIGHEDHAQRACYAALHLQRELASYAAEMRRTEGLNLSVRMGLNSGEVVVGAIGEDLAMAYTAVGHTVGLAQRMEQLAAAGQGVSQRAHGRAGGRPFRAERPRRVPGEGRQRPGAAFTSSRASARRAAGSMSHARAASRASWGATRSSRDARAGVLRTRGT